MQLRNFAAQQCLIVTGWMTDFNNNWFLAVAFLDVKETFDKAW
jgi:hypothetical protein